LCFLDSYTLRGTGDYFNCNYSDRQCPEAAWPDLSKAWCGTTIYPQICTKPLKKRYCKDAQMMEFTDREILKTAHLPENIFRRMRKNNTGYYGPREDGCIRLALAMDIDNILDIDDLVMAGGYAAITEQRNASAKRYMLIVDLLIKTEDLSPEDKVKIFEQLA